MNLAPSTQQRTDTDIADTMDITRGLDAAFAAFTGRSPACSGLDTCVVTTCTVDIRVSL